MKNTVLLLFLCYASSSFAQEKEIFDLTTYTPPAGWTKSGDNNNVNNVISYTITNNQTRTYCQIGIYASTNSKGSLKADFESEWQGLIVKTYHPSQQPEGTTRTIDDDWSAQVGASAFEFDGAQSVATLVTMSGYGRCVSIVIITNTKDYQPAIDQFLKSVVLKKKEVAASPVTASSPAATANSTSSITGTWVASASDQSSFRVKNGVMSTIWRQYTFIDNGAYTFITKTFDPLMDKLLLIKENGTYQVNGSNVTVIPQKSVIEAWSKKDNTDKWGSFLTTQNRALEKVTYQFTKHYFSGVQEWNLVLQSEKENQRDGPHSSNSLYANAWFYNQISTSHPVIILPGQ